MKLVIALSAILLTAACVSDENDVGSDDPALETTAPDVELSATGILDCPGHTWYAVYFEGNPQSDFAACTLHEIEQWRDRNGPCHSPPTPPEAWYYLRTRVRIDFGGVHITTDRFPLCH